MALAHDDRRGQDHRQRKTEILQQVLAQAAQQAGRDRSPGAREAPERQAQSLHDADPDRIAGQDRGPLVGRCAAPPGHNDHDSDRGQCDGDQRGVAKQLLDIRPRRASQHHALDQQHQAQTYDAGAGGGQHHVARERPERRCRGEKAAAPGIPEVGDDRQHGAGMKHHQQKRHRRRGGIQAHELLGDDHVRRT